MEKIEI